jgi:hypothetical protein
MMFLELMKIHVDQVVIKYWPVESPQACITPMRFPHRRIRVSQDIS